MRLVVVGSGRSGTNYVARLLRAAGVRCGHEWAYGLPQWQGEPPNWEDREAEVSWMAVPSLPVPEETVHVVRQPLYVARSIVACGMLAPSPWSDMVRERFPAVGTEEGEANQALRWWIEFTRTALEHAAWTVRLEELDAAALRRMCEVVGNDGERAEEALEARPAHYSQIAAPLDVDCRPDLLVEALDLWSEAPTTA